MPKPAFLSELVVSLKKDSDRIWILKQSLIYQSALIPDLITVPQEFEAMSEDLLKDARRDEEIEAYLEKYFETDFASVPRVPLVYDAFGDRAHYESVIHDYLYCINSKPVVSRKMADDIFLEAMTLRGKGCFVRYAMYSGVRLGGWTAYHKRKVYDKVS